MCLGNRALIAIVKRRDTAIRLTFVFRIACLLSVCSLAAWANASTDALIEKLENRYNHARTLKLNFVEDYSMLGHARPPEEGVLTLRKQGKMRWDYSRPQGKLFISDGRTVYLYTATDNRVEKVPLKDTEDMRAPLAFLLGRLDMKKEFRDFRLREGESGTWLEAAAKNDRVPYKNIQILVGEDGSVRQLKVQLRDEALLAFSFSNEKLNPPVSDDVFQFQIPPGAEVVNSVEFASEER